MNKIQEKKNLKEKLKGFWDKNKSDVSNAARAFVAGIACTVLATVVAEKIGEHNDYKNGTDFTRYMMDRGYTARDAKLRKQWELAYRNDTEKTLGIPLTEKWDEYQDEHPEEFIKW